MEERGVPAYIAEFLGTLVLVLFIGLVVSVNSGGGLGFTDFTVIGLVHFFVLAVLIVTLGGTSGAHFNPAVTVALAALRKIKPADAAIYIAAQIAGAIVAALIVKLLLEDEGQAVAYGGVQISEQFLEGKLLPGLVAEAIGTFILVWAIMGVAVSPKTPVSWAPLAIGGALALAVMCIAPLTGAGFNPARAFGPDLVGTILDDVGIGNFLLAYVVGPVVGALAAAFGYQYLVIGGAGTAPVEKLP